MTIRITGMNSGLDTEAIIQELASARSYKVTSVQKAQTKLSWKMEAWKGLNTKIYGLYTDVLSEMRYVSSYSKRTTKVSNSNAVSVITGANAMNGTQTMTVDKLARTGYLTGAKLAKKATSSTKMSELGFSGTGRISAVCNGKNVDVDITEDTTISDVLGQLRNAGLNASFDEKQQRFFISSKESGEANDFSLTASDANGASALSLLGIQTNLSNDKATLKQYQALSGYVGASDAETIANLESMIKDSVDSRVSSYLNQYKNLLKTIEDNQKKIDKINNSDEYADKPLGTVEEYTARITELEARIKELKAISDSDITPEEFGELEEKQKELDDVKSRKTDAELLLKYQGNIDKANADIAEVEKYVTITSDTDADGKVTYTAADAGKIREEEEASFLAKANYAKSVLDAYDPDNDPATGATKISAQNAAITLNGVEFTSTTNAFEINGLTYTVMQETAPGEEITITTDQDTDGIYDMIKNFLTKYNELINEMDKLYNAASTKGYEPLTDEEKEAMSDTEIEKWETKIKDSLLRRDSTLSSVANALKNVMASGIESADGTMLYLSDFGINTLGYFNSGENEKNAYHIDGDPDDAKTKTEADVLKGLIASDPDKVIAFFSSLSKKLYSTLDEQMARSDYSSAFTVYNDKQMQTELTEYDTKIKTEQDKLDDFMDKWYQKFSKMETALAKMQSKQSAIAGLFGGTTSN